MGMSPIPTRQSAASALVSVVLLVLFAIANARGFIRFFQTRMRFPDIALTYDPILSPYPAEDTFVSHWRYVRGPLKIPSWANEDMFVHSIQHIYCKAQIPPSCGKVVFGPDELEPEFNTPSDIPVYVPKGTADLYRNAVGWNYFTNFIETDDFPTSVKSTLATSSIEVYGHNGT